MLQVPSRNRPLKASVDTTRRALDPKQLGAHVADNIEELMGQSVQAFAKGIQLNHDAAQANQNAASNTANANADLNTKLQNLDRESRTLANIAERLEERDKRSKWDWVTLGCAMLVAAGLAGGGAYYYAKAQIEADDFQRSIQLITQDDDATWCNRYANGQTVQANDGTWFCAISMPNYAATDEQAE